MTTVIPSSNRTAAPHPPGHSGFTLIELLVVIAILGILAAMLLPVLGRSQEKARDAYCLNNLKQLGVAVRLYSEDNRGRLPGAEAVPTQPVHTNAPLPRIVDVLGPYVGRAPGAAASTNGASVFRCPNDSYGRFQSEGSSYEWNYDLNGLRIDETQKVQNGFFKIVTDTSDNGAPAEPVVTTGAISLSTTPDTTPMLADYENVHHGNGDQYTKNLVFMDGHVRRLN